MNLKVLLPLQGGVSDEKIQTFAIFFRNFQFFFSLSAIILRSILQGSTIQLQKKPEALPYFI